ncbi:hypothetical protein HDV01_005120 [Terramyces sp. JEL0728]|nr:hypothetical protein HDV01_005120 [Terramyces sp. JEL0728]
MHLERIEQELIIESHLLKEKKSFKKFIYVAALFLFGASVLTLHYTKADRPLVILVSLDGTRPEYLERGLTPNINKIGSSGFKTEMIPDDGFGKLLYGIADRKIESTTEIVIVSDHGMGATDVAKVIYLDDLVPENEYDVIYNGVLVYLYPKIQAQTRAIADKFKIEAKSQGTFKIWLKDEIPYDVHYDNIRVGPILLIPERGWNFVFRSTYSPDQPPFPKGTRI